jgi:hypothetical protein
MKKMLFLFVLVFASKVQASDFFMDVDSFAVSEPFRCTPKVQESRFADPLKSARSSVESLLEAEKVDSFTFTESFTQEDGNALHIHCDTIIPVQLLQKLAKRVLIKEGYHVLKVQTTCDMNPAEMRVYQARIKDVDYTFDDQTKIATRKYNPEKDCLALNDNLSTSDVHLCDGQALVRAKKSIKRYLDQECSGAMYSFEIDEERYTLIVRINQCLTGKHLKELAKRALCNGCYTLKIGLQCSSDELLDYKQVAEGAGYSFGDDEAKTVAFAVHTATYSFKPYSWDDLRALASINS